MVNEKKMVDPQEFGAVKAHIQRLQSDSDKHYSSNEKRKEEFHAIREETKGMAAQLEEMDNILRGQARALEGLHDEMHEIKNEGKDTALKVERILGILEGQEKPPSNISKILDALKTNRILAIWLIVLTIVLGLLFNPEIGGALSSIFNLKGAM